MIRKTFTFNIRLFGIHVNDCRVCSPFFSHLFYIFGVVFFLYPFYILCCANIEKHFNMTTNSRRFDHLYVDYEEKYCNLNERTPEKNNNNINIRKYVRINTAYAATETKKLALKRRKNLHTAKKEKHYVYRFMS